jgi:endogenous inhibitor of DNA gyrase (YacG/DUF329 family)
MLDMGQWLDEEYKIPTQYITEDLTDKGFSNEH